MNWLLRPIRRWLFGGKCSSGPTFKTEEPNRIHPEPENSASIQTTLGDAGTDVHIQHLWCDQANGLKVQIDRALLPIGESRAFAQSDEAFDSPLAHAVFTIPGIRVVVIDTVSVSVEMDEDADWEGIRDQLPLTIRKFFLAGGSPFTDQPPATESRTMSKFNFGFKQIESRPRDEQMTIVSDLFDNEINPAIESHGGFFKLLDIKDNNVYVELGGGCQGCSMADVTLRQGVETRLKEVLPEMVALIDSTDHASGSNPYFSGGKK